LGPWGVVYTALFDASAYVCGALSNLNANLLLSIPSLEKAVYRSNIMGVCKSPVYCYEATVQCITMPIVLWGFFVRFRLTELAAGLDIRRSRVTVVSEFWQVSEEQLKTKWSSCQLKKTPWLASASELYGPTERPPLVGEVSANFSG
jgi:hypothetical protein